MVSIPPEWQGTLRYISNIFQVRPEWLIFPNVITIFIVPLVLNIWMFYIFLSKIVRVFGSGGVNWVIAGVMGFLVLPYNSYLIYVTPAIIGFFGFQRVVAKILFTVLLYGINLWLLPWLTGALATGSFRI